MCMKDGGERVMGFPGCDLGSDAQITEKTGNQLTEGRESPRSPLVRRLICLFY